MLLGPTTGMKAVGPDSARTFFGASRRVSSPSSGIHISFRSPWMSFAVRSCVAFLTRFSMSRRPMRLSFTRSFTARKTPKSGGRASDTVRKQLPNIQGCMAARNDPANAPEVEQARQ
jgi:hypothetical protein